MIRELQIKCSIEEHDQVELACLNQTCKTNRIYCHQCLKNGDGEELIKYFNYIEKESENQIAELNLMVKKLNKLFTQLKQGLKKNINYLKRYCYNWIQNN
ncbi:unnamed protein product [Paramecium sonneborni]|uniref:Uncharacterized protein n=1 Tax=Paramecium sonneborni TaxID=65129 RepID=A0A8S1RNV8_9CILI|nr:unnamed protein product [Paramecium sonneborni]